MKRIYIKEEVCIGCSLCEVYCQMEHSRSKDLIKAFKVETPRPLPRLRVEAKKPVFLSVRCQHCEEPPCVYACLTGALQRETGSGVVTVDEERCVGCWTCILVCPFGAIRADTYRRRIAKCDLCPGEETPVCVTNCPNEALVYLKNGANAPA
jgi:carbon-monoxide dehydrogenase iron sulfur subunit